MKPRHDDELKTRWQANPTEGESKRYREILKEEMEGMEANKARGRELLAERREIGEIVAELKSIREQLKLTLTKLAERTDMTVSNLSRFWLAPSQALTINLMPSPKIPGQRPRSS